MASRSHSLRALEQPPAAGEREADGEAFSRSQSAPIAIDARDRRKLECGKNGSNSSADDSSASSSFERVVSAADTRRNVFSSQRDVSSPLSPADCSVESATSTPETAEGASCLGGGSIEGYRQPGKKWKTGRKYEVMEGLQFMALSDLGKLEEVLAWERSTGHSLDSSFFSLEKYTRSVFEGEEDINLITVGIHQVSHFASDLDPILKEQMSLGKRVVLVANADVVSRTNAATLVSCYLVFRKGFTAAQAWAPFNFTVGPDPFCLCGDDYTGHQASLDISPIDIVEGLYQAMSLGVFDADGFDPEAYASLEEMECCADAVKGSFITLRAPKDEFSRTKADYENGIVHGPAEYIEPFKERGVTTVVRLCQEEYDEAVFVGSGFKHINLCFAERSLPTEELLTQWFATCCQEIMTGGGCIAVHCKDGVGRSQLLVACFLMARHKMTSRRAIGYLRLIWPGSIAGLQQEFLEENQEYLWRIGKSHETKPRCDEISRVSKSERRAPGTRRRLLRWGSSESVDEETEKSHFSMVQVKESAVEMARKARDIAMAAKKRAAKIAASKGSVAEGKEAAGTSSWYTRCKNTYKIVKGGRRKKINPLDELDHSGRHDDLIGTLSL